jgi:hypothetical protein
VRRSPLSRYALILGCFLRGTTNYKADSAIRRRSCVRGCCDA